MKAEDTVMTLLQLAQKDPDKTYLEAQAKISFKAGQEDVMLETKMGTLTVSVLVKRGRKEVIDWVNENVNWREDAPTKSTICPEDWKTQVKEWLK